MMLNVLHSLSSLVDTVYKKFVFKSLEIHSYDIMRQPISSPMMSSMAVRYLKDDIIIKATEEQLLENCFKLDSIIYPFTYMKNDTNEGFMICNSSSCFGHEKNFDGLLEYLNQR